VPRGAVVDDQDEGQDRAVRAGLLQVVLIVHHYLPESSLSVRERVDVRRDLTFLVSESHRQTFRRAVVLEVSAAMLAEVAQALPEQVGTTMLRSCAAHLDWTLTDDGGLTDRIGDPLAFVRAETAVSSPGGDADASSRAHDADGRPQGRTAGRAAGRDGSSAGPPGPPGSPPRPRSGRHDGRA
jgi:hypothetical protein